MKTELLYGLFKESNGVSTDSRNIKRGEIFFALRGDNFNGNKYVANALEKGALCAVIDDPFYQTANTILVDDCLPELQALASRYRKELNVPVMAVTGTNGKTTTKELLAAIISKKLKLNYTSGNLNNHIGVPLTILSAPPDTEMMIIEMGASHIGEIRSLCLIANPDYGLITNIGTAHIEGFGSFDGVVKTKTELYEYLRAVDGIAIYNDKNPLLSEKISELMIRAVPYSSPTGTDLIVNKIPSELFLNVSVTYQHQTQIINTHLFGDHNLENVRAAIATGLFFGVDTTDIIDSIGSYQPANNRSQIKISESNTLICDSYNANPVSMANAITSFTSINTKAKVAILGDMLELGERTVEEHTGIVDILAASGFDKVILVGPVFTEVARKSEYLLFPDVNKLIEYLRANPIRDKTILVKGSRGTSLGKIYPFL